MGALTTPTITALTFDESLALKESIARTFQKYPEGRGLKLTHTFHAGMYARTLFMPKGTAVGGSHIKIPTLVIMCGDAEWNVGNAGSVARLRGCHVLPAMGDRRQVVQAHEDTSITMVFPSTATSVAEAEKQFTDEWAELIHNPEDVSVITGI